MDEADDLFGVTAAVAWLLERHPSAERVSTRRSVRLVLEAVCELIDEPLFGRGQHPDAFRMPATAIAKRCRDLSKAKFVDPGEVQLIVDAFVATGGLVLLEAGDPAAKTPRAQSALYRLNLPRPSPERVAESAPIEPLGLFDKGDPQE